MKSKKLLAILCACTLAFAVAVPAIAAGLETEFTATTDLSDVGTVSVAVKSSDTNLYLNSTGAPYELADADVVDSDSDVTMTVKGSIVTDTFFTDPGLIMNYGESALKVAVTLTEETDGTAEFAASQTAATNHTLNGNLVIAKTATEGLEVTPKWDSSTSGDVEKYAIHTLAAASSAQDITAQLGGATEGQDPATFATITIPGTLAFRLAGEYIPGSDDWDVDGSAHSGTADSATVTLAFTFEPVS